MVRQYGQPPLRPGETERDRQRAPERPKEDPTPSADVVTKFHQNAAVDTKPTDIHHTLGNGRNQAAPGDHNHKDDGSNQLLSGVVITGSRGNNAALFSLIQALKPFGLTDQTSA